MHRDRLFRADAARDALDCPLALRADTDVIAEFGEQPKEVNVALETPRIEDLVKPLTVAPPKPIQPEKLDDKPLEVAIAPPKPPPPPKI